MAVEDRAAARLAEIAAMLGCPVETFLAPQDGALDLLMTQELLALWSTIHQPEVRQQVIAYVRSLAGARESAPAAAE